MNCPVCEQEMNENDVGDLIVDLCPHCDGVWFDSGELKPFIDLALTQRKDIPHGEYSDPEEHWPADELEGALLDCPRCRSVLEKFNYAYDSNIILERCSECEGLWSDRESIGELASFLKGDPKADRLYAAMSRFVDVSDRYSRRMQEKKEFRQASRGAGGGITALRPLPKSKHGPMLPPNYDDTYVHGKQRDLLAVSQERDTAWMILAIVAINAYIFAMYVLGTDGESKPLGLNPQLFVSGSDFPSLFTYMFVHPTMVLTFLHGAMLWLVGKDLEKEFGHTLFLLGYIACGLLAGALHVATHIHSELAIAGSAGAVAGVAGMYLGRHPFMALRGRITAPVMDLPPIICVMGWLLVLPVLKFVYGKVGVQLDMGWFAIVCTMALGILAGWIYTSLNEIPET